VGKKWVPISREEFPKQLAIENESFRLDEISRDPTRVGFSDSSQWKSHKRLWYFLLTGEEWEQVREWVGDEHRLVHDPFPDTEAFSFFLKHIKPHWKFNNPVLDMDFTPYEGMHPGQIPFPEEVGQPGSK
jgi:hypothetical protein